MSVFARFRAIEEKDKAAVVRKLLQSSTPNFDFYYLTGLSVLMASLGLLLDSTSIVIGSMLIAPLLYPILGVALGLIMSNYEVLSRSMLTLIHSLAIGMLLAAGAALLFGDNEVITNEILLRTEPSLIHFLVAVVAGAAVSFALAQPEWSETLPGIAISVALIPPLAVVGIGVAYVDIAIISGSIVLLLMNLAGIMFAAMVSFSLMNLYEKQNIAASTIKREEEKVQKEKEAIAEVIEQETKLEKEQAEKLMEKARDTHSSNT